MHSIPHQMALTADFTSDGWSIAHSGTLSSSLRTIEKALPTIASADTRKLQIVRYKAMRNNISFPGNFCPRFNTPLLLWRHWLSQCLTVRLEAEVVDSCLWSTSHGTHNVQLRSFVVQEGSAGFRQILVLLSKHSCMKCMKHWSIAFWTVGQYSPTNSRLIVELSVYMVPLTDNGSMSKCNELGQSMANSQSACWCISAAIQTFTGHENYAIVFFSARSSIIMPNRTTVLQNNAVAVFSYNKWNNYDN